MHWTRGADFTAAAPGGAILRGHGPRQGHVAQDAGTARAEGRTVATDLTPQITDAAATPQSAAVDGQSATARPIAELIAADQYVKQAAGAAVGRRRGLRFSKLLASGPVSDQGGTKTGGSFGSPGLV